MPKGTPPTRRPIGPPPRRRRIGLVAVIAAALIALVLYQIEGGSAPAARPPAHVPARATPRPVGVMRLVDGTWQRVAPGDPRAGISITRRPDGTLRVEGRVYERDKGTPVAAVEVVFAGLTGEATTEADGNGRYHVDVTPGIYRAFVRGDGVLSVGPRIDDRLPSPPLPGVAGLPDDQIAPILAVYEDQDAIDLAVVRGGTISGHVRDRSGHPVEGAVVRALGSQVRPVLGTDLAETDGTGAFRLEVPSGGYRLEASHPDFAGLPDDDTQFVVVEPGQDIDQDLVIERGCVIAGRVLTARGGAGSDGAIERRFGSVETDFAPAGKIDADGTFRWATTETGPVVLRAWPWKAPPTESQQFDCRDGARFTDIVFTVPDRAPDIAGVVRTADGKPVPFAYLDITALSPGGINQQERADADGVWGVYAMPPGDYQIQVFDAAAGVVNTTVTAPRTDLVLTLGGTGAIAGAVKGIDAGSFTLELGGCDDGSGREDRVRRQVVVPVRSGTYRVDGVPACSQAVIAHGPDRQQVDAVTVARGGVATLDLDLSPRKKKKVTGVVTGPTGAPVEGATVTAAYGDEAARAETDGGGRYEIETYAGEGIYAYKSELQAFAMVGEADVAEEHLDLRLEQAPEIDDED